MIEKYKSDLFQQATCHIPTQSVHYREDER